LTLFECVCLVAQIVRAAASDTAEGDFINRRRPLFIPQFSSAFITRRRPR